MAIGKTIIVEAYGKQLEFTNAYHQVTLIIGNKTGITATINIYEDATKNNLIMEKQHFFVPSVAADSPNFIEQTYNALKLLEEYEGAIDIWEEGQTPLTE